MLNLYYDGHQVYFACPQCCAYYRQFAQPLDVSADEEALFEIERQAHLADGGLCQLCEEVLYALPEAFERKRVMEPQGACSP